jgi:hypothetical protein
MYPGFGWFSYDGFRSNQMRCAKLLKFKCGYGFCIYAAANAAIPMKFEIKCFRSCGYNYKYFSISIMRINIE